MKRRLIASVVVIVAVLATAMWVRAAWMNYPNIHGSIWEAWSGDYGEGIKDADSNFYLFTRSGGKISLYGTPTITDANRVLEASSSGVTIDKPLYVNGNATIGNASTDSLSIVAATKVTEFSRPATVINSYSQLSSWTGQAATNGVSWYQLEAGKVYEIDLAALAHSQVGYVCSGVTLLAWDASSTNDQRPATITVLPPSGSRLASEISGATPIYVMPFPGTSGLTSYGKSAENYAEVYRSACTPQTLQGDKEAVANDGMLMTGDVISGNSVMVLNKIGESLAMQTRYNSAVSAFLTAHNLKQ